MSRVEGQDAKTSYRGCIMGKVLHTGLAAGGRFRFILDSVLSFNIHT